MQDDDGDGIPNIDDFDNNNDGVPDSYEQDSKRFEMPEEILDYRGRKSKKGAQS